MKITKITLGKSLKLSVNYQSVQVNVGLEAEIEEGDNVEQVRNKLAELIDRILKEEIEGQIKLLTNERR